MKNKSRQKKKKVWWLRLIHAVAFVFVLLLLCCVALLGFIQTEKGRNLLADILSEKLSGNGVYVNITGVKSGLPVLIGFDSLSVADKNGAWLRVDDVRLEWAWMEIFRKKVKVTLWKVDSIKMLRKPVMPSKKKEKSPNKSPSFAFLQGLGFELQYLSLNRVQLGSEQDNSNVTFSVKSDLAFQMLPKKMKLNLLVAGDVSGLIDVNAENKGFDGQIDRILLEELDLFIDDDRTLAEQWAEILSEVIFDDEERQKLFVKHFAIVDDNVLNFLCETGLPVDARIAIDSETGTVKKGALWYEETVPMESVFAGIMGVDKSYNKNVNADADALSKILTGSGVIHCQVGGKSTTGKGFVALNFYGKEV